MVRVAQVEVTVTVVTVVEEELEGVRSGGRVRVVEDEKACARGGFGEPPKLVAKPQSPGGHVEDTESTASVGGAPEEALPTPGAAPQANDAAVGHVVTVRLAK